MVKRARRWLRQLGPGLITGAADDDPSGIATYSQAGAQFGYQLGWTVVLTYPLMVGIQLISARMGRVTGHGLADNIRRHFPRPVLYAIVAMLVMANTINVAADIAAMGEALRLVIGGRAHYYAIVFGGVCLVLQVFLSYRQYVSYLRWLTLSLLHDQARIRQGDPLNNCCQNFSRCKVNINRRPGDRQYTHKGAQAFYYATVKTLDLN